MIYYRYADYSKLVDQCRTVSTDILLSDHLDGFSIDLSNWLLDLLAANNFSKTVFLQYTVDDRLRQAYQTIDVRFSLEAQYHTILSKLHDYTVHPPVRFQNFLCSFNGSEHVGRKFLVSAIHKFKFWHPDFVSKNFSFDIDTLDGHIEDYVTDQAVFYRKFLIDETNKDFYRQINSFGHERFAHAANVEHLENKLSQSFLHVVSETLATSYYPFVTEKFLYSVVTRGLFLAYAQPGWHQHLEKYYGFKKFEKIFDYQFDSINNPVVRLVSLMTMISKFANLSRLEWHDLYELEHDIIEYNYDHYFSKRYLDRLRVCV